MTAALIESTERAPGVPGPPPLSREARQLADAILSAYVDEETMTVGTVRRLIADAYDMGAKAGEHKAFIASLLRGRS